VSRIQVINNSKIIQDVPYSKWVGDGKVGPIKCSQSGWVIIRVLTECTGVYRVAMTAPFFIEIGESPKYISKASVEFFLDWARQAAELNAEVDPDKSYTFNAYSKQTIKFWENLLTQANAE